MPGELYRQRVKAFHQENRLVPGTLRLRGELVEHVADERPEVLELPGGHASLIVGRQPSTRLRLALAESFAGLETVSR